MTFEEIKSQFPLGSLVKIQEEAARKSDVFPEGFVMSWEYDDREQEIWYVMINPKGEMPTEIIGFTIDEIEVVK